MILVYFKLYRVYMLEIKFYKISVNLVAFYYCNLFWESWYLFGVEVGDLWEGFGVVEDFMVLDWFNNWFIKKVR